MKRLLLILTTLLPLGLSAQVTIDGLYNTGVDDNGNALAAGATDDHYVVTSETVSDLTSYAITGHEKWTADFSEGSDSMWLSPYKDSNGGWINSIENTTYTYTLTFDLSGYDLSSVYISGIWATDNEGISLFLNGVDMGYSAGQTSFSNQNPEQFTLSSGFKEGDNTLAFTVFNQSGPSGNPTGLRVEFLSASASAIPEPSTYALVFGGLALALFLIRKPSKKD